ncbi:MAG: Macrolide export protein MacA [Verrucomicrobiae bacterium]|nr:Macrolide export protein MacA [Verrucomicrobiae bacterium]
MKKVLIGVAVLAVAAAAWLGLRRGEPPGAKAAVPASDSVRAERRDIKVVVESVGEINPANQVAVKAEVSGKIQRIEVGVGQVVKRGELLLALDDTDLLTEKQGAQTEIEGAKLQLAKSRRDFVRNQELFTSNLVSKEVFENAKTAQDLAQNDFERAQRRLQTVEDKLQKVRILAPFDGTVLTLPVSKGQVVSGATSVSQGTELMTFADLNALVIRSHVSQVDITRIAVGQAAEIRVDSLVDAKMAGRVTLIAPIATVRNGIKGFSVEVLITQGDARIRPGMNANLTFPVATAVGTVAVPVSAVFAEGREKVVYVRRGTVPERRVVTVGATDYNFCEITAGLQDGEVVLLEKPVKS